MVKEGFYRDLIDKKNIKLSEDITFSDKDIMGTPEYKVVFEDDDFIVYKPNSKYGLIQLGVDTGWFRGWDSDYNEIDEINYDHWRLDNWNTSYVLIFKNKKKNNRFFIYRSSFVSASGAEYSTSSKLANTGDIDLVKFFIEEKIPYVSNPLRGLLPTIEVNNKIKGNENGVAYYPDDFVISKDKYVNKNKLKFKKVIIKDGVTEIPAHTFAWMTKLQEIVIPESVVSIGTGAFKGAGIKTLTLPSNLTSLPVNMCFLCRKLQSIELPQNLMSIGNSCFYYCENLKQIKLPDSTKSIGEQCFADCTRLSKVELNDGLDSISQYAFSYCSNLKNLFIPNTVTSIERNILFGTDCTIWTDASQKPNDWDDLFNGNRLLYGEYTSCTVVYGASRSSVPINESLREEMIDDLFVTESAYEAKNYLLNHKNTSWRIVADESYPLYLIGSAYDCIHLDMINLAKESGYNISDNVYSDKGVVCLIFSAMDNYNFPEIDNEAAADDDYGYSYEWDDFVIYSRYVPFSKVKKLYREFKETCGKPVMFPIREEEKDWISVKEPFDNIYNNVEKYFNETLLKEIMKDYLAPDNHSGKCFITKDGTIYNVDAVSLSHMGFIYEMFLKSYKKVTGKHLDTVDWTDDELEKLYSKLQDLAYWDYNWIQCSNEFYTAMNKEPTTNQYKSYEKWLYNYMNSGKKSIQIDAFNDKWEFKTYYFKDYLPEDIIKNIKRYYTTGELVESVLKEDISSTDLKPEPPVFSSSKYEVYMPVTGLDLVLFNLPVFNKMKKYIDKDAEDHRFYYENDSNRNESTPSMEDLKRLPVKYILKPKNNNESSSTIIINDLDNLGQNFILPFGDNAIFVNAEVTSNTLVYNGEECKELADSKLEILALEIADYLISLKDKRLIDWFINNDEIIGRAIKIIMCYNDLKKNYSNELEYPSEEYTNMVRGNLVGVGGLVYIFRHIDKDRLEKENEAISFAAHTIFVSERENKNDLFTINVKNGVQNITNKDSFSYNQFYNKIKLPNTVHLLGEATFAGSKLEEINIPNSVDSIGKMCFAYTPLKSITIPKSVKSMGRDVFWNCDKLKYIDLDMTEEEYNQLDWDPLWNRNFGNSTIPLRFKK